MRPNCQTVEENQRPVNTIISAKRGHSWKIQTITLLNGGDTEIVVLFFFPFLSRINCVATCCRSSHAAALSFPNMNQQFSLFGDVLLSKYIQNKTKTTPPKHSHYKTRNFIFVGFRSREDDFGAFCIKQVSDCTQRAPAPTNGGGRFPPEQSMKRKEEVW